MVAPVRTCVGCRQRSAQSELVRLVAATGTSTVLVDRGRTAPGRGAYLHPDPDCAELAIRRRAIGRALRLAGGDADQIGDVVRSVCPHPAPIT